MSNARRNANLLAVAAAMAAGLLYRFPPQQYHFYPVCPVYRYLHLYCPGCGSTRALSALLHGRVFEATHYNPLFVALLPLLLACAIAAYWTAILRNEVKWPQIPVPAISLFLATAAIFTIVRNF
jgi:hypothetical protein